MKNELFASSIKKVIWFDYGHRKYIEPLGWTLWLEIAIMCSQRGIVVVNYTQWIYMLINMPFYFMSYLWEPCFKYNTIIFWRQYRLHISSHPHTLSLCHTHMYAAILSPRWNFFLHRASLELSFLLLTHMCVTLT